MKQEPDIVINVGGTHEAKGIVAGIIANALTNAGVADVSHLNYDEENFKVMREAISESSENNLSTAKVVILEWDEDEIDNMMVPFDDEGNT